MSAFNICTRKKIPMLSGSLPLKPNVGEEVTPVACHKPVVVPLYRLGAVRWIRVRSKTGSHCKSPPLNTITVTDQDTNKMARALLDYRNTPDTQTGLSQTQIVFGRQLQGFLPWAGANFQKEDKW